MNGVSALRDLRCGLRGMVSAVSQLLDAPPPDSAPDPRSGKTARPNGASDVRWDANAVAVAGWIGSGGFPATGREDLLRDVVTLWDGFAPDHSAWNTAAALLSTLAAMRDTPETESPAFRALADLAAQIEGCASGAAGAEERAVAAVRRVAAVLSPETSG
jgi:hypothetical protein